MISFRDSTNTVGASASARDLAAQLHVEAPISLRQVIAASIAEQNIQGKYVQIGERRSPLGRPLDPVSHGVNFNGQEFSRDYAGGQIVFSSQDGASAFATHQTTVRFRGIHCFGKSEAEDEPYAIVGVYASDRQVNTVTMKFPGGSGGYEHFVEHTDASDSTDIINDLLAPQTLVIVSVVMENDSGDPARITAAVEDALKKAASAAGAAEEVSVFTGILDDIGIPGLIADLLGVGDDLIGSQVLQIDIHEQIPKRPMQQFGNISFNFESPLLSDGDASYKLYYEVFTEIVPPRQLDTVVP